MKLFEVPPNTRIVVYDLPDEPFMFHHIDGMYSHCTNDDGDVFLFGASTEVSIVPDKE